MTKLHAILPWCVPAIMNGDGLIAMLDEVRGPLQRKSLLGQCRALFRKDHGSSLAAQRLYVVHFAAL